MYVADSSFSHTVWFFLHTAKNNSESFLSFFPHYRKYLSIQNKNPHMKLIWFNLLIFFHYKKNYLCIENTHEQCGYVKERICVNISIIPRWFSRPIAVKSNLLLAHIYDSNELMLARVMCFFHSFFFAVLFLPTTTTSHIAHTRILTSSTEILAQPERSFIIDSSSRLLEIETAAAATRNGW